jgi:high-affinity Fe2+/Pb2+ permease
MIELMASMYAWLMSGVCIAAIIAALFYWYAVHIDSKQQNDFDKKYRGSRDVKGYKSGKSGRLVWFTPKK